MKFVGFILTVVLSSSAFAGTEGTGGGVGYQCIHNNKKLVYLADSFELLQAGALHHLNGLQQSEVIEAAAQAINETMPAEFFVSESGGQPIVSIGYLILARYSGMTFNLQYLPSPLAPTNDDNITVLPSNCQKVQIAVQRHADNSVDLDRALFEAMSPIEQHLLVLHELLLAVRNQPGADTTLVRDNVSLIAQQLASSNSALSVKLVQKLQTKARR
jgi:hypothetical protein